jgi:methyltransferase-like protein
MNTMSKILKLFNVNDEDEKLKANQDQDNNEQKTMNDYSAVSRMNAEELNNWLKTKDIEPETLKVLKDYRCDGMIFIALTDSSLEEMFPATSKKHDERKEELRRRMLLRMRRDAVLASKPGQSGK